MEEDPKTEDLKQENYKINQTCDICNNGDITRHKQTHDLKIVNLEHIKLMI